MQRLGFIVFIAGVILAGWYGARYVPEEEITANGPGGITSMDRLVAWGERSGIPFTIGTLLMVGGAIVARRSMSRAQASTTAPSGDSPDTRAMLQQIRDAVVDLPRAEPDRHATVLHDALDRILEDVVPAFLEQRHRHVAILGLGRYAEMTSAFASAERALGRAWSALTDEAWAEVPPCLERARRSITDAIDIVDHSD